MIEIEYKLAEVKQELETDWMEMPVAVRKQKQLQVQVLEERIEEHYSRVEQYTEQYTEQDTEQDTEQYTEQDTEKSYLGSLESLEDAVGELIEAEDYQVLYIDSENEEQGELTTVLAGVDYAVEVQLRREGVIVLATRLLPKRDRKANCDGDDNYTYTTDMSRVSRYLEYFLK